jgi:thiamine-monophosphate kinase
MAVDGSVEDMVLHYGGDYELLFTIRPDMLDAVKGALGDEFSVIGRAEGSENVLMRGGQVSQLESRGYEHFMR